MKKLISVFLIVCCVLSLCACEAVEKISEVELPPVPTSDAVEKSEEGTAAQNMPTETEHQHIIINMSRSEYEAYDPQQGTELILSFSYETPYVHIPANTVAEDAINEFIAMLDESYYTGDDYGVVFKSECAPGYINMLTSAEDHYNYIAASGAEGIGYELANHRTLSVQRCDEHLLSLRYYDYINLGGVHGGYAYRGYNFDTQTGELITLDALSDDSARLKQFLKNYMLDLVNESPELQQRMEGFVDVEGMPTKEQALEALVRDGAWCFDDNGMLIVSDLYELGSYAAGTMEFCVPYKSLEGYIKPEYMPEDISAKASFSVLPVEALTESKREIIDMVRIRDDGVGVYLVAEGTAKNVRLTAVDYTEHFYETEQLWYCSVMQDCAVQIVTDIPEGMPNLKISYTDADGQHSYYLSQSGLDGSLMLVDDSIEAVG